MMAVAALLCAACTRQSPRLPEHARVVAGGDPKHGPAAMLEYGCASCHTIPGVRGADALVGPPLTGWAKRRYIAGRVPNEPDKLVEWILHPQGIKPGTAMPDMGVKGDDALHMAAYLYTLK
jgi:cytochrome c2